MSFLIEALFESAKLRSFAPISQQTFDNDKLLLIANEEMRTKVVPRIMGVRENFFLASKSQALTALKSRYPMPERAVGNALKDLWLLDSSGAKVRRLRKYDVHELPNSSDRADQPYGFMLQGDEFKVIPTPATGISCTLEEWYFSRPNELVLTESCAKITAVSSAGGTSTFTVDTDLTESLAAGDKVDFLSAKSPFLLWAQDSVITAITATTIAVATTDVSDEASSVEPIVGDYICPAQQACIPMIPIEFHPCLAQLMAIRMVHSLNDQGKKESLRVELEGDKGRGIPGMWDEAFKLIANRVESELQHVAPSNGILSAIGTGGGGLGANFRP